MPPHHASILSLPYDIYAVQHRVWHVFLYYGRPIAATRLDGSIEAPWLPSAVQGEPIIDSMRMHYIHALHHAG